MYLDFYNYSNPKVSWSCQTLKPNGFFMVLDKSPSVPYAGRSLGEGGGGNYSNIRVLPDYFLVKWIIFKVCEHEYMNKCP